MNTPYEVEEHVKALYRHALKAGSLDAVRKRYPDLPYISIEAGTPMVSAIAHCVCRDVWDWVIDSVDGATFFMVMGRKDRFVHLFEAINNGNNTIKSNADIA